MLQGRRYVGEGRAASQGENCTTPRGSKHTDDNVNHTLQDGQSGSLVKFRWPGMLGFTEKLSYWLGFGAHLFFREFCRKSLVATVWPNLRHRNGVRGIQGGGILGEIDLCHNFSKNISRFQIRSTLGRHRKQWTPAEFCVSAHLSLLDCLPLSWLVSRMAFWTKETVNVKTHWSTWKDTQHFKPLGKRESKSQWGITLPHLYGWLQSGRQILTGVSKDVEKLDPVTLCWGEWDMV